MKTLLHTAALLAGAAALALLSGSAAAQLSVDHQVGIPGFIPASYGGGGMGGARLMRAGYTPGDEYGARREADLTKGVNKELDRSVVLLRDFNRWMDDLIGDKPKGVTQTAALTSTTATDASTPASPTSKASPVVTPKTSPPPTKTAAPPPAPDPGPAPPPATPPPQVVDEPTVNAPRPYQPPPPRRSPQDILRGPMVPPHDR